MRRSSTQVSGLLISDPRLWIFSGLGGLNQHTITSLGWQKQAKLPKLSFLPEADEFAFGFLDPSLVLRGCHLIPAFADGKIPESLTTMPNVAEAPSSGVLYSWSHYYVGMWVISVLGGEY